MTSNVTKQDVKLILESYKAWKNLNISLGNFASRTVNFPEAISESLACFNLGYEWHNKTQTKKVGDATSGNGKLVEIKATSNFDRDLTSFSPKTKFEILIFARLNLLYDELYIYDLKMNFSEFERMSVNSSQTIAEQQENKRRPRLSLVKYIEDKNMKPLSILDLKKLGNEVGVTI
jgi:hypothetical protein